MYIVARLFNKEFILILLICMASIHPNGLTIIRKGVGGISLFYVFSFFSSNKGKEVDKIFFPTNLLSPFSCKQSKRVNLATSLVSP